jgi:hypothetical protein
MAWNDRALGTDHTPDGSWRTSHCLMYKDIADCDKMTCFGCRLENSNKSDPHPSIKLPEGCIASDGTTGVHACSAVEIGCDLIIDPHRPCKAKRYQFPEYKEEVE